MNQKPVSPGRQVPRPIVRPTFPSKPSIKEQLPASGVPESKPATTPIIIDKPESRAMDLKFSENTTPLVSPSEGKEEKPPDKPAEGYKKKPAREED
jgi:hypothetical protein